MHSENLMFESEGPAAGLAKVVERAVQAHTDLAGRREPLYRLIIGMVERPLIECILERARGNRSRAALILGVSRNTLSTLIKRHRL